MIKRVLNNKHVRNVLITLISLLFAIGLSFLLHEAFEIPDQASMIFVFAVFMISLLTDGYAYGIFATFISVIFINYAFTAPYFDIDFTAFENIFSAAVMVIISLITSTVTTKIKLWQRLKALGEQEIMRANLLRAVSHDLRTPLTTIYGSSSAIAENYDTLTDAQKKKMAEGIKEDTEWLIRIVENLLSITKIGSVNTRIIKTPTVLEELIDSVIIKFKKRYQSQSVDIQIPDDLVVIQVDPLLIEQVLINLLENAVQHALGMTKLSLKVFLKNEEAVFEIKDNGCGIDTAMIDKIFSGHYNLSEGLSTVPESNAGIGLSVCDTIIKAHGGKISAENSKNGGAVFKFSLAVDKTDEELNDNDSQ